MPIRHHGRPLPFVEINRELIPIKHMPIEPRAITFNRFRCHRL